MLYLIKREDFRMKRLHEIIRPFLAIILGALLLLMYLNSFQGEGEVLDIGIIAMVVAAFYIGVGVVGLTLNNRLPGTAKKVEGSLQRQ